jgi:hypothetical protein
MSEFNILMMDTFLSDVEDFMKYLSRKRLTPETTKRVNSAGEAVKSLRSFLDTEKKEAEQQNAAEITGEVER